MQLFNHIRRFLHHRSIFGNHVNCNNYITTISTGGKMREQICFIGAGLVHQHSQVVTATTPKSTSNITRLSDLKELPTGTSCYVSSYIRKTVITVVFIEHNLISTNSGIRKMSSIVLDSDQHHDLVNTKWYTRYIVINTQIHCVKGHLLYLSYT